MAEIQVGKVNKIYVDLTYQSFLSAGLYVQCSEGSHPLGKCQKISMHQHQQEAFSANVILSYLLYF